MDVVQLVKDGKAKFEWSEIVSEHNGHKLHIKVFRDALKFDDVPAMTWNMNVIDPNQTYDGVRLPTSAYQLQQIADLLGCMLMTTKVIDMIWLQAGIKFNAVINVNGGIVATSHIHLLHNKIEDQFTDDGTSLISCVGKYWCLTNTLNNGGLRFGSSTACNYGWMDNNGSGPCISPGTQCWQRPGFQHNHQHHDPSQTIRLMHRKANLVKPNGTEEEIDLHDIADDPQLAPLMTTEGSLTYLRQKNVPELDPIDIYDPTPEPPTFDKWKNFVDFFS